MRVVKMIFLYFRSTQVGLLHTEGLTLYTDLAGHLLLSASLVIWQPHQIRSLMLLPSVPTDNPSIKVLYYISDISKPN